MKVRFLAGLDLGLAQQFTALSIVERTCEVGAPKDTAQYAVRHLERFAMGTAYSDVAQRLNEVLNGLQDCKLVVDQTAVGKPVVQMLRQACRMRIAPVTVTAGHEATSDHGGWLVPKKVLVSSLQILLQTRRIKVASELADAQLLVEELANFRMKFPPVGDDLLASWRERPHDDLVLSVAIAVWYADARRPFGFS